MKHLKQRMLIFLTISKHIYDGWIPIVIRKSDGHRVHYGEYMLGDDQTWTYRKKIKF